MTRKTQLIVGAAIVAAGVAVSAYLWITREKPAADDAAAQTQTAPPTKSTEPAKMDPAVAGQIRDAYQKNLSDNGPPGMVDLMNGRGGSQTSGSNLPPLDPFVVPAGHHVPADTEPVPNLPPLPGDLKPKAAPTGKAPIPEAPKNLPPLSPVPNR